MRRPGVVDILHPLAIPTAFGYTEKREEGGTAMASFTQQALRHTLLMLLERQPLDKITVKMLVDACGVSRNTFYYHYEDIPALLADALEAEFAKTAQTGQGDPLFRLLTLVAEHRQVFAHIDASQSREILQRRLYQAMEKGVRRSLAEAGGDGLPPLQQETLAVFFAGGIWRLFQAWLEEGAQESPSAFLARISAVQRLMRQAVLLADWDTSG